LYFDNLSKNILAYTLHREKKSVKNKMGLVRRVLCTVHLQKALPFPEELRFLISF
jgi:hypothetical protein